MFIVLYLVIVKKNKRCVIMTSATNDGARKLLNQYRAQFEANERLKYFYGNLIGDKWTEDYFTLSTRVSFMAMAGDSHRAESKWTRYARTYCSWMTTIPTRNAAIRR